MDKLTDIITHNLRAIEQANGEQNLAEDLVTVEFNGTEVYDLTHDESLRFEVEPTEYYGLEKIREMFNKYDELVKDDFGYDEHFQAPVRLLTERDENIIQCSLDVKHHENPYTWKVEVLFDSDDKAKILEELKKEQYIYEGSTETW